MNAGRELDALVARTLGLDVRGTAFAIHVEGEWSVHGEGDPDGWMCYAGTEPVYRPKGDYETPRPALEDSLRGMEYGNTREQCEAYHAEKVAEWDRAVERWGCHYFDLEVVPEYSTDIAAAWEVVMHLTDERMGDPWPGNHGWWVSVYRGQPTGWTAEVGATVVETAPTAPLAICLAALKAHGVEP